MKFLFLLSEFFYFIRDRKIKLSEGMEINLAEIEAC